MEQKIAKKNHKADLLLVAGIVLVGVIIGLILLFTRQTGKTVQVRVSGQVVKSFSLAEETEYEITGTNSGTNLLLIKGGEAWIEEADCPDKLCRNMGKISLAGQSVVCLPHEVVVEIVDETAADENGVDVVAE